MASSKTQTKTESQSSTDDPVPWNVVLLNDEEHTYEYVMEMVQKLFGHPIEKAFAIAKAVDSDGRAVCLTTHKEHAEFKCEQILAYGPDKAIAECVGSMSAIIEPAEFGGDEGDES